MVVATDHVDLTVLHDAFPLMLLAGLIVLVGVGAALDLARAPPDPADPRDRAGRGPARDRRPLGARRRAAGHRRRARRARGTRSTRWPSQLEQARGSEHAFLLSISHDLRTPLTSIRGYAEALADGTLDDADPNERKRAATIIGAEGRRLERLVRDLLDLSRLDAHQFSLHAAAVRRDRGRARRGRGVRAAGARARRRR